MAFREAERISVTPQVPRINDLTIIVEMDNVILGIPVVIQDMEIGVEMDNLTLTSVGAKSSMLLIF